MTYLHIVPLRVGMLIKQYICEQLDSHKNNSFQLRRLGVHKLEHLRTKWLWVNFVNDKNKNGVFRGTVSEHVLTAITDGQIEDA